MAKQMLIDATHPEETRVVVVSGSRLEEFDFESNARRQLKGNIYLAKVTRVEPSLQAAFVDYGGNRHGFLPFSEIHPDYYRIPIADRQALVAEEAARQKQAADAERDEEGDGGDEDGADSATAEAASEEAADAGGESDGELDGVAVERPNGEAREAEASGNGEAQPEPAAEAEAKGANGAANGGELEEVEVETRVDTVGGDEIDEDANKRAASPRRYKIQEVIKRRQVLLVQVSKEERGTKGAALTTYLSLAGRYCVLMPNTNKGGGISRKIGNVPDRRRLKKVISELAIPEGMAVIVRTAGSQRSKAEIRRDYQYLLRLWDEIRETTLQSEAPCLIYEEANLIKRAIRDLYSRDMERVLVAGEEGYKIGKAFMKSLMPSHARNVQVYKDEEVPLLQRYQVERQLDDMHNSTVELKSGGYIVINPTEALVAIDVNSGRATRERHIEETALKTNVEAAQEVARQLRLRDLAGLIVIDFIDMEEPRHNREVERRLKEAMRNDRARIQLGRISPFGLLEMSRQRLRPSLFESSTEPCGTCGGRGFVRSTESSSLHVLRVLEEEGVRRQGGTIVVAVPLAVALELLNEKRSRLIEIEQRYTLKIQVDQNDALIPPDFELKRFNEDGEEERDRGQSAEAAEGEEGRRRRRRRRKKDGEAAAAEPESRPETRPETREEAPDEPEEAQDEELSAEAGDGDEEQPKGRRRRGKRGGRRRSRRRKDLAGEETSDGEAPEQDGDEGEPAEDAAESESGEEASSQAGSAADGETPGDEAAAAAEDKPKPKRRSRRRSASSGRKRASAGPDEPTEVPAGDNSSEDGSAEAASAAQPERKTRRRSSASRSRRAEPKAGSAENPKAGPAEAEPSPTNSEPVAIDFGSAAPESRPVAASGESDGTPDYQAPKPAAEPAASPSESEADRPKRKGWWSRFI